MFGLGAGELVLIFVLAIIFLGPKKLPELAKGLGQAMKEFQRARDEMMNEIQKPANLESDKKVEETPAVIAEAKEVNTQITAESNTNSVQTNANTKQS